jgi:hypothetical protein
LPPRGADQLLGGDPLIGVELIEEVGIGAERHRRRMARLPRDVDDGGPWAMSRLTKLWRRS